eukprot:comp23746_c0_seq1/m.41012 comp23746_c0_seq1/g.41012  ORF comp23746_c0_seq1/g.41012 comp23746_c0_seq1/m.41012 type:complete len:738 (-) comp23746_c0_seq1:109-2322(-)
MGNRQTKAAGKQPDKSDPAGKPLQRGASAVSVQSESLEQKKQKGEVAFEEEQAITVLPFFEDITKNNIRKLLTYCERKSYKKGDKIVEQESEEDAFYVIINGDVQLSTVDGDGSSKVLACKGPGQFFGSMFLDDSGHQLVFAAVSAEAASDTTLLVIPPARFQQFLDEVPDAAACVAPLRGDYSMRVRLQSLPFLRDVDERKLHLLAVLFEFRRCAAGQTVCRQGDNAEGLYIVVKGRCNVSVLTDTQQGQTEVHFGALGPGDWFGEIALVEHTKRTADVTTSQDCLFLYISYKNFQKFLQVAPEVQQSKAFGEIIRKRTAGTLKAVPFFNVLAKKQVGPMVLYDEEKLALLGSLFRFTQFSQGEMLWREGDSSDSMYIVVSGAVSISITLDAQPSLLQDYGQNELLGERALLEDSVRTTTATATTDCVLLQLRKEHFNAFLEVAPSFQSMLQQLAAVRTADRMRSLPFFAQVKENKPWSKLGLLGGLFVFEFLPAGKVLFEEGDAGDKFYIVVRGAVEVYTGTGDSRAILSELRANQFFGEMALLNNSPRSASVLCKEDSLLLTLSAENFSKFTKVAPELIDQLRPIVEARTAATLKLMPLFKGISENKPWSKLDLLASMFVYETHDQGTVIVKQGDPGNRFYVVSVGELQVSSVLEDGTEAVLPPLRPGDYFGEIALLNNEPRTATVTVTKRCVLISLARESFQTFLKIAPEMAEVLNTSMVERRARAHTLTEPR